MSDFERELIQKTIELIPFAHAPYSKFLVACTVVTEDGEIFHGVNVENASYGLTICAERVAVANMIPKTKNRKIKTVIVLSKSKLKTPPCGACRQVISEFASSNCEVILPHGDLYSKVTRHDFTNLLPHSFSLD